MCGKGSEGNEARWLWALFVQAMAGQGRLGVEDKLRWKTGCLPAFRKSTPQHPESRMKAMEPILVHRRSRVNQLVRASISVVFMVPFLYGFAWGVSLHPFIVGLGGKAVTARACIIIHERQNR